MEVFFFFFFVFAAPVSNRALACAHTTAIYLIAHLSSPEVMAFLRRLIVARTVAAGPVESCQQPPAMVLWQVFDLHCQIPAATRLTFSLPQKLHMYLDFC
mmetsp:Transcript_508/g.460  ORF Transcript_508/g.460 Transcript_508/m.460 type:complete len:100 (-) Transcript_508:177-476(-)